MSGEYKNGGKVANGEQPRRASRPRSRGSRRSRDRRRRRDSRDRSRSGGGGRRGGGTSRSRRRRGDNRSRSRDRRRRSSRRRRRRRRSPSSESSSSSAGDPATSAAPSSSFGLVGSKSASSTNTARVAPALLGPDSTPADSKATLSARTLCMANLPLHMRLTAQDLMGFCASTVMAMGVQTPHPVLSCTIGNDRAVGSLEFRAVGDCTASLELMKGLRLGGRVLQITRPNAYAEPAEKLKDYVVAMQKGSYKPPRSLAPGLSGPPGFSGPPGVPGPHGFPRNPAQMRGGAPPPGFPGMPPFGPFVVPPGTLPMGMPGGLAGFEAALESVAAGGRRAEPKNDSSSSAQTKVIILSNMVTADELNDPAEFNDIKIDVHEECKQYGKVGAVAIPRPGHGHDKENIGCVFVLFQAQDQAARAKKALHGRTFGDNQVQVQFFAEKLFVDVLALCMVAEMQQTADARQKVQVSSGPAATPAAKGSLEEEQAGIDLD